MNPFTTAAELKRQFDLAFTRPAVTEREPVVELLAVRIAGEPYALRLSEVGAIAAGRELTPLPGPHADVVGLLGVRGRLVAVFDLACLLGVMPRATKTRWVAVTAADSELGLAFETLEAHLRVPVASLHALGDGAHALAEHGVRSDGLFRPIVGIARIQQLLSDRSGHARPGKAT